MRGLRRTALLPEKDDDLRVLARASRLAESASGVQAVWEGIKREVRDIHVRLFYRPLLSAVAALPEGERTLSTEQARDRLAAIGFRDPAGALRHIAALTSGLSRKATIQRHLMPIMIRWFADGVDPDYGLLVFRRISERLGNTPWFLRMLRDSAGAAESLTRVLSGSRYIGELMEWIPESVAWLDDDALLRPRSGKALEDEARAIQTRWQNIDDAMRSVRALRRREMLRVAMAAVLGTVSLEELSDALTTITEVTIQATLRAVRRVVVPPEDDDLDFAVIAMGRFGGRELGFGSDADVMYVYRANGVDPQRASQLALKIVAGLREQSEDHRLPLDLDAELRPEGRSGPLARSIEAYTEYYRRWSLSWEAQALLRARGVAGSVKLIAAFMELADEVRYPVSADQNGLREIRRIKARVENERLPQGADPARHLKLGPGSLSDVEWLVQLLQLQHARAVPDMRTTSTLGALEAATVAGLVERDASDKLAAAWHLASRLRSANTLLSGQTSDILPVDRGRLDGIGRILEYAPAPRRRSRRITSARRDGPGGSSTSSSTADHPSAAAAGRPARPGRPFTRTLEASSAPPRRSSDGCRSGRAVGIRCCRRAQDMRRSRTSRRWTLPMSERGRSSTTTTRRGTLYAASLCLQKSRIASGSTWTPSRSTIAAATSSPPLDFGSATTAAPAMSGWEVRTSSTSLGETLKPPVMMISFKRSTMVTNPSGDTDAMSPVRSHPPSRRVAAVSDGRFQ